MIQTYLEKDAFEEYECDGMEGRSFSIKIVRGKTYSKVVIYNFSYIGYKEYYSEEHDENGEHKRLERYENSIEYKKKVRR